MIQRLLIKLIPINWIDKIILNKRADPKKIEKFLIKTKPWIFEELGKKKLLYTFKKVAEEVPRYKKFLKQKHINVSKINSLDKFNQFVPEINKENYIKKAKHYKNLCWKKDLSMIDTWYTSSGYTGKTTVWPMSEEEHEESKIFTTIGLDLLYQTYKYKTLFINTFALGSWITGMELARIADGHCSVINTGDDIYQVSQIIKQFKGEYKQIIIAGYPPFIKELVDSKESKKINWKKLRVNFLLGAESFPEDLRTYLYKKINRKINKKRKVGHIYAGFGASDIGVTGINESYECVAIRKFAMNNSKLRKALFGDKNILPMLFQYDPLHFHIDTNKKKELLFSITDLHRPVPLIKYNLKDMGGVISYSDMKKILSNAGHKLDLRLPFPFVYVIGRGGGTINYYGSLIFPDTIKAILLSQPMLAKKTTMDFRMAVVYDKKMNPTIKVDIQLKKGQKGNEKEFNKYLINGLLKNVPDLKPKAEYFKKMKKKIIKVKLYKYDKFPEKTSIKRHYI